MGPTAAVASAFRNYFDFSSRASRSEYWWFTLFDIVVLIAAMFVDLLVFQSWLSLTTLVCIVAMAVPALSVTVRRLHDIDRSGWWIFISMVPVVGDLILLFWFCTPGTVGDNRFGPDPLATWRDPSSPAAEPASPGNSPINRL